VIERWLMFLRGFVTVSIQSPNAAELLSRLVRAGFQVSDVQALPGRTEWRMTVGAAKRLHHLAAGLHVRVRFGDRGGLPFAWRRARGRPGLWIGALAVVWMLSYAAPRVWVVTVVDTSPVLAARVMSAAEEAGVRPGVPRQALSVRAIERAVMGRVPGLAWVGVRIEGALVIVSLHRFYGRAPYAGPVSVLVASHAAVIRAVHVYLGEALVDTGQQVRQGAPLVKGWPVAGGRTGGAAADVVGQYLASTTAYQSRTLEVVRTTGRQMVRSYLVLSDDVLAVPGRVGKPFRRWRSVVISRPIEWFGVPIPGAWVEVVYNELEVVPVRLTVAEAVRRARKSAEARFLGRLPPGARVADKRVTCESRSGGAWCTVQAQVQENIAVPEFKVAHHQP